MKNLNRQKSATNSNFGADETGEAAKLALPAGKLLKRGDVARRLGLSQSTVRRMEGKTLQPSLGPRGTRYFVEEHVEAVLVRIRRTQLAEPPDSTGALAAQVFERFRCGLNAVDVVKELRIDPDWVETLAADWHAYGRRCCFENPNYAPCVARSIRRPSPMVRPFSPRSPNTRAARSTTAAYAATRQPRTAGNARKPSGRGSFRRRQPLGCFKDG